jgi:hypothetical protein
LLGRRKPGGPLASGFWLMTVHAALLLLTLEAVTTDLVSPSA